MFVARVFVSTDFAAVDSAVRRGIARPVSGVKRYIPDLHEGAGVLIESHGR